MSKKLEELNARQAAIRKEMAEIEEPLYTETLSIIEDVRKHPGFARLAEILPDLPASALKNAVANIGAALTGTHTLVALELPNLRAVIAPPAVEDPAAARPLAES